MSKKKKEVLIEITKEDYNDILEFLITASCESGGKKSLLEIAKEELERTDDFYEEITLRLLIRLHNYGEINLNEHFDYVKEDA